MRFETKLLSMDGRNTGIEVAPEDVEALGAGKRPPVKVSVNGFEYRSTIAPMGGRFLIPFSSDKRAATGLGADDAITVELTLDTEPRTVEVPDDLQLALDAAPVAKRAYEALSPSRKKAIVTNVTGAKAPETRARRIEKAVAELGG
ncbi:YdeI/OmpD-associated family protein [Agromyces archimandritae]|uniref:DUF1905 domain-containing protein n=1 Tax=Agromyces archimandritae TaxID=2781962 RepID=A0A975FR47_9MICO|nr:YdeI/OmpD-associated family protein [Agromyces archimandritae]QTX05701.1 DUF1905 domain-containing protein [Agromyces archimandritae]